MSLIETAGKAMLRGAAPLAAGGVSWSKVVSPLNRPCGVDDGVLGHLRPGHLGRLNSVPLSGSGAGVAYLRFTMKGPQASSPYLDSSEVEVYGTATQ